MRLVPSIYVASLTVTDPDSGLPVSVEIRKLASGSMVGIDSSYLENDAGPVFSPYDEHQIIDIATNEDISPLDIESLDAFFDGYIECALWLSPGSDSEFLDGDRTPDDIDPTSLVRMRDECRSFMHAHLDQLSNLVVQAGATWSRHGQDFWLTRNRHGAGFWDRGYGAIGDQLTESCRPYGSCEVSIGADGRILVE